MSKIFISYKRDDKDIVFPIVEEIKNRTGVECWIDLEGIESGDQFQNIIIDAIEKADIMICMLSKKYIAPYRDELTGEIIPKKQSFPEKEVMYALSENKRIIPISIDGTRVSDCKWLKFNCGGLDSIEWSIEEQRQKFLKNIVTWTNKPCHDVHQEQAQIMNDSGPSNSEKKYDSQKSSECNNLPEEECSCILTDKKSTSPNILVKAYNKDKEGARNGCAKAQYDLGDCYLDGVCVKQSYKKAAKWYKKAAEQGFAPAQYKLGICYSKGIGVTQSYNEAFKLFQKAAVQGETDAQYNLGLCYYNGEGVTDYPEGALKWFKIAAEKGHIRAICKLGDMYKYGTGVDISYKKTIKLYRQAAELGDAEAQYELAYCYYHGHGVAKSYKKYEEWLIKAGEQGYLEAQTDLAWYYYASHPELAAKWFHKASAQGDAESKYQLGSLYLKGEGVEPSYENAFNLFLSAAFQGNEDAQYELGQLYELGKGVEQSRRKAKKWYKLAAKNGIRMQINA